VDSAYKNFLLLLIKKRLRNIYISALIWNRMWSFLDRNQTKRSDRF